jgi:hypothetical protein
VTEDVATTLVRLEGKVDRIGDALQASTNALEAKMTYGDRENAALIQANKERVDGLVIAGDLRDKAINERLDGFEERLAAQAKRVSDRRWQLFGWLAVPVILVVLIPAFLALLRLGLK